MAGRIAQDVIDRILAATDIVELIRPYVQLKQSGNRFKGLCPFHEDKNPSMDVSPDFGRYKCWACGASGNALDFVMNMDSVTFPEACELLGDRAAIEIVREGGDDNRPAGPSKREIYRVNEWAAEFYRRRLLHDEGRGCAEYLGGRSITPETWETFQIGFAPDSWDRLCLAGAKKGIPGDLLQSAGLAHVSKRGTLIDVFRNRLMFPIRDGSKRVVGFGGRSLDGNEPKYVTTSETPVFSKSRCLFGANRLQATRSDYPLFVMEGYTDVVMASQAGQLDAVATLGTALTDEHARFLQRLGRRVILVFDGDSAGRKAAERGGRVFASVDLDLQITRLDRGEDPCDFLLRRGADGAKELESSALDFMDFALNESIERHPTETVNGKVRVAREMLALIGAMENPVKVSAALGQVAMSLGVPESDLRTELSARPMQRKRIVPVAQEPEDAEEPILKRPATKAELRAENLLLKAVMNAKELPEGCDRLHVWSFETAAKDTIFREAVRVLSSGQGPVGSLVLGRLQDPEERRLANALIQEEDFSDEEKKALGDFIDFLVDRADSARISQDVQEVTEESDDEQVLAIQEKIRQKHSSRLGRRRPQRDDTPLPPENPRRKPDGPAGGPSEDEDDDLDTACF